MNNARRPTWPSTAASAPPPGKRSSTLHLKTNDDIAICKRLVAEAEHNAPVSTPATIGDDAQFRHRLPFLSCAGRVRSAGMGAHMHDRLAATETVEMTDGRFMLQLGMSHAPLVNYRNNWKRLDSTDHEIPDRSPQLIDALMSWGDTGYPDRHPLEELSPTGVSL